MAKREGLPARPILCLGDGAGDRGSSAAEFREVGAAMRKMLKAGGPAAEGPLGRSRSARAGPGLQSAPRLDAARVRRGGGRHRQIEAKREARGCAARSSRKSMSQTLQPRSRAPRLSLARVSPVCMLGPIALYRWTISPLLGVNCRHLPSCSDYASEAIDTNGAWKGGWLTLARLCRCHPWGSHGFDPVPDLSGRTPSPRALALWQVAVVAT